MDAEKKTMEQLMNESFNFNKIKKGMLLKGEIISSYEDEVVVNINYFCDGIIKKHELTKDIDLGKNYLKGDQIDVIVLSVDDGNGNVSLSEKKAHFRNVINNLNNIYKNKENIEVYIKDKVDAGLICDYEGIRGFIPKSRISINKVDLGDYLNKKMKVRLIDLDLDKNKIIFSGKEIEKEEIDKIKKQILDNVNIGDKFLGIVKNIKDFGVFVDIGGIQGFVHKSQITYKQNFNINDLVKIGDKVTVYVLNFDSETQKIDLTMKDSNYSPYLEYKNDFIEGNVYEVEVVKVLNSGMIVSLNDELTGFIHISEFMDDVNINKDFKIGDKLKAKVIGINIEDKKISLSHKKVFEEENNTYDYVEEKETSNTLGDVFKDLFSKLR